MVLLHSLYLLLGIVGVKTGLQVIFCCSRFLLYQKDIYLNF